MANASAGDVAAIPYGLDVISGIWTKEVDICRTLHVKMVIGSYPCTIMTAAAGLFWGGTDSNGMADAVMLPLPVRPAISCNPGTIRWQTVTGNATGIVGDRVGIMAGQAGRCAGVGIAFEVVSMAQGAGFQIAAVGMGNRCAIPVGIISGTDRRMCGVIVMAPFTAGVADSGDANVETGAAACWGQFAMAVLAHGKICFCIRAMTGKGQIASIKSVWGCAGSVCVAADTAIAGGEAARGRSRAEEVLAVAAFA